MFKLDEATKQEITELWPDKARITSVCLEVFTSLNFDWFGIEENYGTNLRVSRVGSYSAAIGFAVGSAKDAPELIATLEKLSYVDTFSECFDPLKCRKRRQASFERAWEVTCRNKLR